MEKCILIFSMGRSGGEALATSLGKFAGSETYLSEPLLDDNLADETSRYKELVDELVEQIREENIQVLKHNLGTFSELGVSKRKKANRHLFDQFDNIIINGRRNVLKRNLSSIIGGKTNKWHGKTRDYFSNLFQKSFRVDIGEMEKWVLRTKKQWRGNIEYIRNLENVRVVFLEYENFFQEIPLNSRLKHLRGVYKMLLREPPSNENLLEVLDLLSTKKKMNNRDTYSIIKNIESVNKNLGPKFGFLY